MASAGKFMDEVITGIKDTGKTLHSNKAINEIGKNFGGAFEAGYKVMGSPRMGVKEALKDTFTHADTGKLNYGKIAGSYIGASAAARVVSGGGVTRDNNGNSNLIGVPFI